MDSVERIRLKEAKGDDMLVVSRKPGESVWVGDGITITVVEIKGSKIRLGVTAGKETTILRGEICQSKDSPKESSKKVA